jgi:hypothetical protein
MPFRDDEILKRAYDFWVESCPVDGVPTRAQIDPLLIPRPLFPFLILADVLSTEGSVRYRLLGSEMTDRWGENFVGKTSEEVFSGDYRDYLQTSFALCILEQRPVFNASRFRWDVGGIFWTRRLILPIADKAGEGIQQLLIVQTWPGFPLDAERVNPMMVTDDLIREEDLESQVIR